MKYDKEWKYIQQKKSGGWPVFHKEEKGGVWYWHFIKYDNEYERGWWLTRKDAIAENKTKVEGK